MRRQAWMALGVWAAGCGTSAHGDDGDDDMMMPSGATVMLEVDDADLVAYQDGDGDWAVAAGAAGVYRLAVHADRYAVAIGCAGAGTTFYFQSVAEAGRLAATGCVRSANTAIVNVASTGGEPELGQVWIGDAFTFTQPASPATLVVGKGTQDVFARGFTPVFGDDFGVRVYRGPTLDVEGDQLISIDWSQARGVDGYPLALTGSTEQGLWVTVSSYLMPHGHASRTIRQTLGTPTRYVTVPAALRQPGELTRVEASETRNVNPAPNEVYPLLVRSVFQQRETPGPVTLAPGEILAIASPLIDTDAVSQLSVTLPLPPSTLGYTQSTASFTTTQGSGLSRRQDMIVRPGWAAGASTATLTVPDLRNLAGWTSEMALYGRTQVDWTVTVAEQDRPFDAPAGEASGVACTLIGRQTLQPGGVR